VKTRFTQDRTRVDPQKNATHEPPPSATLYSSRLCIEVLPEVFYGAKVTLYRFFERPTRELPAVPRGRGKVFPEERMIDVSWQSTAPIKETKFNRRQRDGRKIQGWRV
jgi:hypothetical protein